MNIRQQRRKFTIVSWILIGMAILVLLVSLYLSWQQEKGITVHHPDDIANGDVAMPTIEKPQPSEFDSYSVAADMPRYLFIEKLGVKAMIKPMGVDRQNRIEAPRSAFDVGWYDRSAKPGESGAVLLDGHVSAGRTPGIFYDLKNLVPGDTITLERGDGVKLAYSVVQSRVYHVDSVDMAAALAPVTADRPGLNLITCTGSPIKGTNNYDQRLIVFTEQL